MYAHLTGHLQAYRQLVSCPSKPAKSSQSLIHCIYQQKPQKVTKVEAEI